MHRILLGVLCGIFFGVVDVLMTRFGNVLACFIATNDV